MILLLTGRESPMSMSKLRSLGAALEPSPRLLIPKGIQQVSDGPFVNGERDKILEGYN